jgi:EAL domain-containing protein (putative c-di-GMP-specific phosphodiesterase class I)
MKEGGVRRHFERGEPIFSEGDAPDCAYLIEEGQVEIWVEQRGERLTLAYLGQGEILGEMAVIDRAPRSASATALGAVTATEIRADQLRERLDEADPILRALLIGLLSRYRRGLRAAGVGPVALLEDSHGLDKLSGDQQRRVADKIRLESELLAAISNGQLAVVFQPVLDVVSGSIAGFEALVRWNHPIRGPVSPGEFITLAEETSLIVPVGQYVLRRACEGLRELDLHLKGRAQPWLAVNVSARQSVLPDFADLMMTAATAAHIAPGRLKAEITESLTIDYERVSVFVARCRHHGIGVSLDDFGTGYSGLAHLGRLDFDSVKLDQSFVRGIPADTKASALLSGITRLLRGLDAEVIAEGVETDEQALALRSMGVRYLQGWWAGRPRDPLDWAPRLNYTTWDEGQNRTSPPTDQTP